MGLCVLNYIDLFVKYIGYLGYVKTSNSNVLLHPPTWESSSTVLQVPVEDQVHIQRTSRPVQFSANWN